jgi:hypothetical protein
VGGVVQHQVMPTVGVQTGRILRWYRSKRLTKTITVERVEQATARIVRRRSQVRRKLLEGNRGLVVVNDGPESILNWLATYPR